MYSSDEYPRGRASPAAWSPPIFVGRARSTRRTPLRPGFVRDSRRARQADGFRGFWPIETRTGASPRPGSRRRLPRRCRRLGCRGGVSAVPNGRSCRSHRQISVWRGIRRETGVRKGRPSGDPSTTCSFGRQGQRRRRAQSPTQPAFCRWERHEPDQARIGLATAGGSGMSPIRRGSDWPRPVGAAWSREAARCGRP